MAPSSRHPSEDRDAAVAYALGVNVRKVLDSSVLVRLQVVVWGDARPSLSEAIERAFGSTQSELRLGPAAARYRHGQFSAIEPGQPVILLVETLTDRSSIEGAVRALRRMGADLCAIVCVSDYRSNAGLSLLSFSGPIPVIAFDTRVTHRTADSFGVGVETDAAASSLAWMSGFVEPTVYIGHIDRGPSRHFTTYLNLGQMLSSREEVAERCARIIAASVSAKLQVVRIVYPRATDHYAERLAQKVREQLERLSPARVVLTPAARASASSDFELSEAVWSDDCFAVVLDWGAVTTATLRDLAGLSARAGAVEMLLLALTSQLDDAAERSLSRIASIRETRAIDTGTLFGPIRGEATVTVPVTTTFVMRVPMGMWTAAECELCWMTHQFREHRRSAPSRLLREHATKKFDLYRPRTREELGGRPMDLMGVALTGAESLEIYSTTLMFRRSRSGKTGSDLLDEIDSWGHRDLTAEAVAWVRLLTVEPYWLHMAPLDQERLREKFANVLTRMLLSATVPLADSKLKWQAAIVLRATSKSQFVDRLGDLVASNIADANVVGELFYGVLTILERPYNRTRAVMNRVLMALLATRDQILELRRDRLVNSEILFTANVLYRRSLELARALDAPDSPMIAWHSLQTDYVLPMKTHVGVLTDMLAVVSAFSPYALGAGPATGRGADQWQRILQNWDACQSFMANAVFPFLPPLRDMLEGFTSTTTMWGDDLLAFSSGRAERFAGAIAAIADDPTRLTEATRAELEIEARSWCQAFLLGTDPTLEGPSQESLLIQVLNENPSDLRGAWGTAVSKLASAGLKYIAIEGEVPQEARVFCPRGLLVDVFEQVLTNAAGPSNAIAGRPAGGPTIAFGAGLYREHWVVEVKNDWSRSRPGGESGLANLRQRLVPFGGTLTHGPIENGSSWTYRVLVRLPAWQTEGNLA